ncbi:MAG: DUF6133 family protein [Eubacteriales bacterium]
MNPMKNLQKRAEKAIANEKGDQNLGSAIQILIAVVIGALLLAGLYTLFDEVVLPTVTDRVQGMFDYSG